MTTLSDFGERRILSEIIPLYANGTGDDCAVLGKSNGTLVITTDPVPPPAASVIGGDEDPYWMGWLLVTINASDIAAAGARPRSFLSALELPSEWPVENLHRLLLGVKESCAAHGLSYIGGNIKEAKAVAATGIAVGECMAAPLGRDAAAPGDIIVSIGQGGQFWSDALFVRGGGSLDKHSSPLFKPVAQTAFVHQFSEAGLLVSAMDVSDGLIPTLRELATKSNTRFLVDLDSMVGEQVRDTSLAVGQAWLGWGDWNVISVVKRNHLNAVAELASNLGASVTPIGQVLAGHGEVRLARGNGADIEAPRLESERFARDSWITRGIDGYIQELLGLKLPS